MLGDASPKLRFEVATFLKDPANLPLIHFMPLKTGKGSQELPRYRYRYIDIDIDINIDIDIDILCIDIDMSIDIDIPGAPKEPKRMAEYPKIENTGSIVFIILTILEVQEGE